MFTAYALPTDHLLPGRSRRGRLLALAVALASAAALALGGASTASAATITLNTSTPVFSASGGSHVEATAYSSFYSGYTLVESTLQQYYGGAWHNVSSRTATAVGAPASVKSFVACTGALTGYSFRTRARNWYWNGSAYAPLSTVWSPTVVRPC